ncbi:hypothetical protein EHS25_001015 [Saitozyma podzolica]|uniref:DNA polymerase delta subunit 3 n=1 Tax=Saitozyma podzolica TaxID=1890683 RepID=A0A427YH60_9TREE|nr:hypothetical protein EHS25_001015 [Saitozyma podzolica]
MSTDQQKSANRRIKQWLETERRIVTYREVAREVGCHINEAKNLLLSYPSEGYRTYLLTGLLLSHSTLAQTQLPLERNGLDEKSLAALSSTQMVRIVDMDQVSEDERNSEDGDMAMEGLGEEAPVLEKEEEGLEGLDAEKVTRFGVVLVGEEGLEEKKGLFEQGQVSIHVYSLSPAPVKDPAQYLVPNVALRQLPSYHAPEKYGTITGDAFAPNVPVPATKPKEMKDGAMDFSGGKKAEKEKKEEGKVKEVAVKKETKSVEQPKKAEVKKVEPPKKEPAKATSKAKKRVIHSDDEDEDDGEGESQSKAGNLPAESSSSKKAAAIKEPTSSMVREADRAAMEAMMGMDMDMDADLDLDMVDEAEESADKSGSRGTKGSKETKSKDVEDKVKKEPQEGAGTSRKRRKVKKSKTEMDDKGYMITRDYYTDESYSGESESEADVSKTKTAKRPSVTKTASRQSSVSNDEPAERRKSGSGTPFGGGAAGSGVGAGKAKPAAKPNAPAARGQSTLAGFFKKK